MCAVHFIIQKRTPTAQKPFCFTLKKGAIIFSSSRFAEGLAVFEDITATLTSGFRTVFVVFVPSRDVTTFQTL